MAFFFNPGIVRLRAIEIPDIPPPPPPTLPPSHYEAFGGPGPCSEWPRYCFFLLVGYLSAGQVLWFMALCVVWGPFLSHSILQLPREPLKERRGCYCGNMGLKEVRGQDLERALSSPFWWLWVCFWPKVHWCFWSVKRILVLNCSFRYVQSDLSDLFPAEMDLVIKLPWTALLC